MDRKTWTPLRLGMLAAGVAGTAFWLGALIEWWRIPDAKRDGLELIGPLLASAYFIILVLPTLVLGAIGRWLVLAAVLGAAVVILASDTLWHWLPWW
jgi:hypothetical protein